MRHIILCPGVILMLMAVRSTANEVAFAQDASKAVGAAAGRQVTNFNADWKFTKGDPTGAEAPGFDDAAWQPVRLPHDWAIAGPFDPNVDGYAGKLPWQGVGWYRKTFTVDGPADGRRVYLDFGGVMAFPKVYINGQLAGEWDYGYMSFRVDATPFVKFGQPNVIAVRADTRQHGTRWYPGAGIYRNVTLSICNSIHFAHWETVITTPQVSDESATINVRTRVRNHGDQAEDVIVDVRLHDPDPTRSALAATASVNVSVPAAGSAEVNVPLNVKSPKRWDVNNPQLYSARIGIHSGNNSSFIDDEEVNVGIRTFELTANDGFYLNGRRVQLYGVDLHHDQGPLGGAFYTRAMERQLEIMKDMGVNALRTSHNPPAPEVLDLCDRMGIVVWDECFDKWDRTADRVPAPGGPPRGEGRRGGRGGPLQPPLEEHGEKQLRQLVMRDRNHPSIIVWSIANEIVPGGRDGLTAERVKFMSDVVRKHDPTRPVTLAHHVTETGATDILAAIDVGGWNYGGRYRMFREHYPDKPIIYSESASALSTRGFYELPLPTAKTEYSAQHQVDSYDYNSARWSDIADLEFDLMERDKFVAGEFVWTGIDYLGEPTPFARQARSSYFGIVDLCGFPKDRYYLYRSHWRPNTTTVHILPHWNWPDRVGKNVPVFVYTNGDNAELFLNGKSLGKRQKATSVPVRVNLVEGKSATANSAADQGSAAQAADGRNGTQWRAAANETGAWWQVDLGAVHPIREVLAAFAGNASDYKFQIKLSKDGSQWQTVAERNEFAEDMGDRLAHGLNTEGRYVRIEFTGVRSPATPIGLRDVFVYPSGYYDITDKYRLKWMDVAYEPGELKAVAYKGNWPIGEAVVRTTGAPAALRLTPDRKGLAASGDDLCYVTIEAIDARGDVCPLADNLVRFQVEGPAEFAASDNGDPLSLESFVKPERKLFYGKALAIFRTKAGAGGEIRIRAESDGLKSASATVNSRP
jgi:beta-galactosidase